MEKEHIIERLHRTQLEIVDEFDRICRKYNLQYFLDSGSALGAIRHQGFIPWDDDVDVAMMRDDYDIFMKIAPKELKPDFYLQNSYNEPNFLVPCAKLRMNNTIFPEHRNKKFAHKGIFIDIFPIDYVSNNTLIAKMEIAIARRLKAMMFMRQTLDEPRSFTHSIVAKCTRIMSVSSWQSLYYKYSTRHQKSKTKYCTCLSYRMMNNHTLIFPMDCMLPSKNTVFEDRNYLIMANPDIYLKIMYGDYMQLPPEEKRYCHIDGEIKFRD